MSLRFSPEEQTPPRDVFGPLVITVIKGNVREVGWCPGELIQDKEKDPMRNNFELIIMPASTVL